MKTLTFISFLLLIPYCDLVQAQQKTGTPGNPGLFTYLGGENQFPYKIEDGITRYQLTKEKLQSTNCIVAGGENSQIEIVSFDITAKYPDLLKTMPNIGACFNQSSSALINNTPKDKIVIIENIKATFADGTLHSLPAIIIDLQ